MKMPFEIAGFGRVAIAAVVCAAIRAVLSDEKLNTCPELVKHFLGPWRQSA
jgi:hypothetical protein